MAVSLPTSYIDKVILTSQSQNGSIVATNAKLRIAIRSNNENLNLSNLEINIIELLDEKLSQLLSSSRELCYYVAHSTEMPQKLPLIILMLAYNLGVLNTLPTENTRRKRTKELKDIFSLINVITLSELNVTMLSKRTDNEGMTDYYFDTISRISQSSKHLSYFVFADMNSNTVTKDSIKISADTIIRNSKLVSQTYAYYLENGELWTGYVHKDGTTWKTGNAGDEPETKQTLTRKIFFNTKIQDFRIIEKITKIPFRIDFLTTNPPKQLFPIQEQHPISLIWKKTNGITAIINLYTLLKKYSKLYDIADTFTISNANFIKKIIVERKRVQILGEQEREEERSIVNFRPNESPVVIPDNRVAFSPIFNTGTYQINVTDTQLVSINVGSYVYTIKVLFTDPILDEFETIRDTLIGDSYSFIKKYYQDSVIPSFYDSELDQMVTEFDTQERRNQIAACFNQFIEYYNKIAVVKIDEDAVRVQLLQAIAPATGSPSSILQFIKIYETLISTYNRIIDSAKITTFYEETKVFDKQSEIINKKVQIQQPNYSTNNNDVIATNIINTLAEYQQNYSVTITSGTLAPPTKSVIGQAAEQPPVELPVFNPVRSGFTDANKTTFEDFRSIVNAINPSTSEAAIKATVRDVNLNPFRGAVNNEKTKELDVSIVSTTANPVINVSGASRAVGTSTSSSPLAGSVSERGGVLSGGRTTSTPPAATYQTRQQSYSTTPIAEKAPPVPPSTNPISDTKKIIEAQSQTPKTISNTQISGNSISEVETEAFKQTVAKQTTVKTIKR